MIEEIDVMIANHQIARTLPLRVFLEGKIFEEQPLGGISRIYHEILPRICTLDRQISFSLLTSEPLLQRLPEHPQIINQHSRLPVRRLLRPQTLFWRIQDYLRAKAQTRSISPGKNTIWHATYYQLPGWWQGPKVVTVYDLIHEKFPHVFAKNYDEILRKRKRRAILVADKVICISETVRSEAIETYNIPQERVAAIPLACGEIFRPLRNEEIPPGYRVEPPFILYLGMRQRYKNFKTLLDAYSAWEHRDEIKLLVVGAPWSRDEQIQIAAAGLESHVILRSGVNDEELCALYNQTLAFVYPSLSEGFGIPLLEAMACGCKIVASRIPVFVEVARDIPYFFEPLSRDDLISALNAACFSGVSKATLDSPLEGYSWSRTARETLRVYEEFASC